MMQYLLGMGILPGGFEWVIILVVALLLFGTRLPKIMRGLGSSVKEFKDGIEVGEAQTTPGSSDKAEKKQD
jgi:sec-independent protein translocase protein TatA